MARGGIRSLAGGVAAVAALDVALTFENAWPTPWPRPAAALSVEVVALIGLMAVAAGAGWLGRTTRLVAGAAVAVLILVRYGTVTSGGLFGRPIDLYWDLRHVPGVAASLIDRWAAWQWAAAVLGLAALLASVGAAAHLAVGAVAGALLRPAARRTVVALSVAGLAAFALAPVPFATPVTPAVVRQAALVLAGVSGARDTAVDGLAHTSGPTPGGADVFVIFVESYGATVLDDPGRRAAMAPAFAALATELAAADWQAASATVTSPTFASASWLAHATLLSGRRVATQGAYSAWLAGAPPTLARRFRAAGYRAVALMPGLKQPWQAGAGMGFDAIHDAAALAYPGPDYGWWAIPDQYALAWLSARELDAPGRAPLFVLYPTIMSHAPFAPVPRYAPDWTLADPFSPPGPAAPRRFADDYVRAIDYQLRLLGGFLARQAPHDALVIALGDHQPPAVVSGPGVRWDVPVHVFARSAAVLDGFVAAGFVPGLTPTPKPVGGMAALTPLLLAASRR